MKWEYKTHCSERVLYSMDLAKWGNEGWELISLVHSHSKITYHPFIYTFKRPKN